MSVCFVINVPGATIEQYEQVRDALGEPLGEGQISHLAGPTDDGICVIDVWESGEDFERFMREKLGEQLQRAGVPEPHIVQFEVRYSEQR